MIIFSVRWSCTPSFEPVLESVSTSSYSIRSVYFFNLDDAKAFFKLELSKTTLQAVSSLDFSPSQEEFASNCVYLSVSKEDTEDDSVYEDVSDDLISDYFWIDF